MHRAAIAQDRLEPILHDAAIGQGAALRQGAELLRFEQDDAGVTATIRDRDTHQTYTVRAGYMIAADGADSSVREALGIRRTGVELLRTIRSVLFTCPEAERYLDKGVQQFEIEQPGLAAFLTHYPDGRWVLMFSDDEGRSDQELHAAIERALGRSMDVEIITTGRWEMAGRIADRYSHGRIFLAATRRTSFRPRAAPRVPTPASTMPSISPGNCRLC